MEKSTLRPLFEYATQILKMMYGEGRNEDESCRSTFHRLQASRQPGLKSVLSDQKSIA